VELHVIGEDLWGYSQKMNQLVYENVRTITSLPIKRIFKRYYSNQHFPDFYLQDGGENQLA